MNDQFDISIRSSIDSYKIDPARTGQLISRILELLATPTGAELSLSLVSETEIQELNLRYRSQNKVTDVLSFPAQNFKKVWPARGQMSFAATKSGTPPFPLGDVVICVPRLIKQAEEIGQSHDRELCFLLIHGILHLLGYDHLEASQEQEMLGMQRQLVEQLEKHDEAAPLWQNCFIHYEQENA